jgi:DNA-binding GntR family transcriptional regulator
MSPVKNHAVGTPLAVQAPAKDLVYDYVRREILWKTGPEGEFLAEEVVGRQLGLSRTPVREAFLRLEAEGFITLVPRKGALVLPMTERLIRDVMEVRRLAESWGARKVMVDPGARAELVGRLTSHHERMIGLTDAESDGEVWTYIECDREFHREIIAAAANQVLLDLYERLRNLQLRMGRRAVGASVRRVHAVNAEHERIIKAFASGKEANALSAISRHLDVTERVLCA